MYTLLKPLLVRERLLETNLKIFTPLEFRRIFHSSFTQTKYFLEYQTKQRLFIRLKQGLYALQTDIPREEEIANKLYKPSYISFEYALAYYNILSEMTYQITSATTKATRVIEVNDKTFMYFSIKQKAYTGYSLISTNNSSYLMAEPEKALVDYGYFIILGKKPINDRLQVKSLNKNKIKHYSGLFDRPKLSTYLNSIL